jgi:hypothetical protein
MEKISIECGISKTTAPFAFPRTMASTDVGCEGRLGSAFLCEFLKEGQIVDPVQHYDTQCSAGKW